MLKTINMNERLYYALTVERQSVNHIAGDIVVNTTTQENVVVGHIGSDISCNKIEESNGVPGGQYMPNK